MRPRFATVSGPCSTSASVSKSHAGFNARALNALVHRPQFSCPPRRQGLALNHNQRINLACFFCSAPCHIRRAVCTLIIHQDEGYSHGLIEQGCDDGSDQFCLIAGRDYSNHAARKSRHNTGGGLSIFNAPEGPLANAR